MPELDAWMCWNHTKNNVFCDISLFQYFHDSGVSRGVLGPHFGGFGDTWLTICDKFRGSWRGIEISMDFRISPGAPLGASIEEVVVKGFFPGSN